MGVGRVNAAAIVARSRTVKSAKLAIGTLASPPTAPKSLVRAWSFTMDPGMLIAVVPKNLGQVSERLISSAMVEIAFAARSGEGGGEGGKADTRTSRKRLPSYMLTLVYRRS